MGSNKIIFMIIFAVIFALMFTNSGIVMLLMMSCIGGFIGYLIGQQMDNKKK